MLRINGGVLGKRVTTPSTTAAKGVWSLIEQSLYTRAGTWPPTKDPLFANTQLLLHMEGANNSTTFTDSSSFSRTGTVTGTAKISTTRQKFGSASGYFDGSGARTVFTVPGFGTGDFTVELQLWINSYKQQYTQLLGTRPTGSGGIHVNDWGIDYGNNGSIYAYSDNTFAQASGTPLSIGTWLHVALTRKSGVARMFVGGSLLGSSSNTQNFTGTSFCIGAANNGANPADCYIDELRLTNVCRYDASFTPPTAAFFDR